MTEQLCDIVVGNGVAAHAFLWTYAKKLKSHHLDLPRRILWIQSPLVPTCSLTSTSLISCAGLQRQTSPFGDQLIDAYELFENYFSANEFVEQALQTHLPHGDLEQFNRRYPTREQGCFIVHHEQFLQKLREEFMQVFDTGLQVITDSVIGEDVDSILTQSGRFNFKRLFLFLGAGNIFYDKNPGGRAVVGQYAQAKVDLGDKAFVHTKGHHNVIYRVKDKTVLIGSLDDKDDHLGWPVLAQRPKAIHQLLNGFEIKIPLNLDWKYFSGVRHKGVKRLPYWGEIRPDVYSVHGLYKNGYTLAFLAAKDLLSRV